nr:ATP-dependent Clp protease proteolytic subunit [Pseudomonas piscis]
MGGQCGLADLCRGRQGKPLLVAQHALLAASASGGFQGRALDVKIYAKEILWMKDRLNKIFAKATGQPLERIAADTERDFWLSAEEAVEYGLVNKIVTTEAEIIQ